MKIDLRHIAKLSRLQLDEDKIPQLEQQIQDIVNMVENMPEMEGDTLPPDPDNAMLLRSDDVMPSMRRDELLANAPCKQAGCVVVPRTV